jgi:60 kDa SS-A/Ro ribonucleoprotein
MHKRSNLTFFNKIDIHFVIFGLIRLQYFTLIEKNQIYRFGRIHPCEAIRQYRKYSERPSAKLVVVGMCATEFTIADQDDPNMIDVVGFDSAAPRLLSEFALDRI